MTRNTDFDDLTLSQLRQRAEECADAGFDQAASALLTALRFRIMEG